MNHIDLFSGIGGFALAVRNVWGEEYHNLFFCDNSQFCQQVIKKNFGKDSLIYDDIKKVTKDRFIADTQKCNAKEEERIQQGNGQKLFQHRRRIWGESDRDGRARVDLLTGGFPCQPFSMAGKRKGTTDDRYLWPEMFRVIQEFRPRWIIGENVGGLLSMAEFKGDIEVESETNLFGDKSNRETKTGRGVLFGIIEQLGEIGYAVQVYVIPACAVNAPHRRDRVWIVAKDTRCEYGEGTTDGGQSKREVSSQETTTKSERPVSDDGEGIVTHSDNPRGRTSPSEDDKNWEKKGERRDKLTLAKLIGQNSTNPDLSGERLQGKKCKKQSGNSRRPVPQNRGEQNSWDANWLEVATEFCRIYDGVSVWMDKLKSVMEVEDGDAIKNYGSENMSILREKVQSEEIRSKLGGLFKMDDQEVLLPFLLRIQEVSNGQDFISQEGWTNAEILLRELWNGSDVRCSPYRREYQKQLAGKLADTMPFLPHEIALAIAKSWDNLQCFVSSVNSDTAELDGFKLSKSKHREERLKSLGNAIVPQVAEQIMRAIKETEMI